MSSEPGYYDSGSPASPQSDSGYATLNSSYNSSTVNSSYASPTFSNEPEGPFGSDRRSEAGLQHGVTTPSRAGSIRGVASRPASADRVKVDEETRYRALGRHLYTKACSMRWMEPGVPQSLARSGVLIRRTNGDYVVEPRNIDQRLLAAVQRINPGVALTISTDGIDAVFDMLGEAERFTFSNGSHIQTVESLDAIAHSVSVKKFQYAALVRQERMVLVWHDDLGAILSQAIDIEARISGLTSGSAESPFGECDSGLEPYASSIHADSTAGLSIGKEKDAEIYVEEMDDDMDYNMNTVNFGPDESLSRPAIFTSAIYVTLGVVLMSILVFGFGNRALLIQVKVDHFYPRLVLILSEPFFFCLGLFFAIVIFNNCFQLCGPMTELKMNSRFYSAIKPHLAQARALGFTPPPITIQMPIFTESLEVVIKPTVASLQAAISYYESRGGTARIFINDDGMSLRSEVDNVLFKEFYINNNIGWVARPKHNFNGFIRGGKFKKASNMNYALNVSVRVEQAMQRSIDDLCEKGLENLAVDQESEIYEDALRQVLEADPRAKAGGDIRIGDIILLVDSDTIVPEDCLMYGAAEMFLSPEVAIVQHSTGVMQVSWDWFENGLAYFTNLVYTTIRFAVGSGETAPFVGHNAFIRWRAVQDVAEPTNDEGYVRFWSESHVSEDFDMALRLQIKGNTIRLANYHNGGFKEGISLSIFDELDRWEKYAYGCSELVFNPIHTWLLKGPFTPLFRKFLGADLQPSSKMTIVGYISSYYALASAVPLGLLNYFLIGWFNGRLDRFYVESFQIFVALLVVFNLISNICLAAMRYRLGEMGLLASLWENFKWMPFFMVFFGGVSFHLLLAICAHMLGIDKTWGATGKEKVNSSFFEEVPKIWRRFKWMYALMLSILGAMIFFGCFAPRGWDIKGITSCVPMAVSLAMHLLLPLALNPSLLGFNY
ncbi:hypothetical protein BU25DRAFT_439989 [Macroventuria anomochaeta]|uniref:Uncharacterized protein n=1 Tax=Macroventuria anomochaeta TaxID=301207 RepID=A0ACB6S376_9PLEO|nr:uncharacterized protein BU25DRAFT_439989 [Macroventuria anomochaeta]KAF2627592.1 hypothetical protein BU25DRAFT_439989 [Macroventuria anomochaeta]